MSSAALGAESIAVRDKTFPSFLPGLDVVVDSSRSRWAASVSVHTCSERGTQLGLAFNHFTNKRGWQQLFTMSSLGVSPYLYWTRHSTGNGIGHFKRADVQTNVVDDICSRWAASVSAHTCSERGTQLGLALVTLNVQMYKQTWWTTVVHYEQPRCHSIPVVNVALNWGWHWSL